MTHAPDQGLQSPPEAPGESSLTLATFRALFDPRLEAYMAERTRATSQISSNQRIATLVNHAHTLTSAGGKRVRPYIALLAYEMAGGADKTHALEALIGIELFHVFALIHDDIIDRAPLRHGIPTVHALAATLLDETVGSPERRTQIADAYAILVGDLVFAWSQDALVSNADERHRSDVLSVFREMIDDVIVGQMIDVGLTTHKTATTHDIEEKNRLKTARYTFVHPLRIGAALAGAKGFQDAFFIAFGESLGSYYQIQDDLLDIIGDAQTGKLPLRDLEEGQHTYFTQHIREHGTPAQIDLLNSLFGTPLTDESRASALALMHESGAIDAGRAIMQERLSQVTASLETADIPAPQAQALRELLIAISRRSS